MNTELYYFEYASKKIGSLGTEIQYNLCFSIFDFKWLLDNQTNREIRPKNPNVQKDGNDEGCDIKVQFAGEENELIKIYYKIRKSTFVEYKVIFNNNLNHEIKKGRGWVSKNKWQIIANWPKKTIIKMDFTNLVLDLEFVFSQSNGNNMKTHNHYPPQRYPQDESHILISNSVNNSLISLLMNKDFSDVTVKSVDGDEFPAHKCFLVTRSAVIRAHFEHNTVESQTNVIESQFNTEIVKNVLSYIYTDNAPNIEEMPLNLLKAADFYQLIGLKNLCETVLAKNLTVENAIEVLEVAILYRAMYLKRKILEFISDGLAGEITLTEGWKALKSVEIIKSIYEYVIVK